DLLQFEQVAIGLFHFQDDVLLRSADVEQADNLRVAQLAQLEQDADFVGDEGPGLVPAIDELQGDARAVRQLGLPDVAERSTADAAEEPVSGNRFHANFKHDARLRKGPGHARRGPPSRGRGNTLNLMLHFAVLQTTGLTSSGAARSPLGVLKDWSAKPQ